MGNYPYDLTLRHGQSFKVIPFSFSGVPANSTASAKYTLSAGWNFICVGINATNHANCKFNIINAFTGERLFTDLAYGSLVAGTGQYTFVLPKPFAIRQTETIELQVMNITGSAQNYEFALIGYKSIYLEKDITKPETIEKIQYKPEALYIIPFDFSIPAGQTASNTKSISKEFDFKLEYINSYYNRDFTFNMRDSFRNEDFFEGNVRASLVTGNGQLPFILPIPYVFKGGTNIKLTINNIDMSNPLTAQIALIGYKMRKI